MKEEDLMVARQYLNAYWPKKKSTSVMKNDFVSGRYDLTVIIPCYNEERYIEQCIDSVLKQINRYKIKAVIVDDGSTDGTASILKKYERQSNIVVIHQKNGGHSSARNRGLKEVESRYIYFVDADDYLLDNSLESMLDEAMRHQVDIMEAKMANLMGSQLISRDASLKGTKEVRREELTGYIAGKIINSELFHEVCFPEQYLYEDSIMAYLIYPRCNKIMRYGQEVYVYRMNPAGITAQSQGKREAVDTYWITELMMEDMEKLGIEMNQDIYKLLLNQVALNYIRTKDQEANVKVAIYMLTAEWIKKLHIHYKTDARFQMILEKALSIPDYNLYEKGCAILWNRIIQERFV